MRFESERVLATINGDSRDDFHFLKRARAVGATATATPMSVEELLALPQAANIEESAAYPEGPPILAVEILSPSDK
jgi:hypothetical protein